MARRVLLAGFCAALVACAAAAAPRAARGDALARAAAAKRSRSHPAAAAPLSAAARAAPGSSGVSSVAAPLSAASRAAPGGVGVGVSAASRAAQVRGAPPLAAAPLHHLRSPASGVSSRSSSSSSASSSSSSSSVSLAAAASAPPPTPLVEVHTPSAWFGSSALSLQGPRDPVAMLTTWVYPPEEVLGYRPAVNASKPAWRGDTTRDLKYQTLYVESASGRSAALPAGSVDALAFWNRKPDGIVGDCVLIGFDSAAAPDLAFSPPRRGSWHYNLTSDCSNINGAVPWPRFALSDDGATAVAWTQGGAAPNVTVYAFDGQTGALRWKVETPCGTPDECDYFLSYGVDVSDDGRFVVFDEGVLGEPHRLHVLNAADGTPRCAPVLSPDAVSAHVSPNGDYMYTSDDPGNPSSGNFSTWRWSATTKSYALVGSGTPPLPGGADGWTSAEYAFSLDAATNTTFLGVVWFDTTLAGDSILAVFDAAAPAAPRSTYVMPGIDNGFANAGAVVDCSGALCAAGFWTQQVGGPQNTLVALSGADAGFLFNFTTPGSVDAVSILEDRLGGGRYYLLGVGCASLGVCTQPGGDAYMFELQP